MTRGAFGLRHAVFYPVECVFKRGVLPFFFIQQGVSSVLIRARFAEGSTASLSRRSLPPASAPFPSTSVRVVTGSTVCFTNHKAVRDAVFAVMVVALRLDSKHTVATLLPSDEAATAPARRQTRATDAAEAANPPLPLLPIEIWLFAMRFFQRLWWGA